MNDETDEIQCSIFHQHENRIKSITQDINSYEKASDKKPFAEKLIELTEILLNCENYNEDNPVCVNCHTITTLRKRTANLISKASLIFCRQS